MYELTHLYRDIMGWIYLVFSNDIMIKRDAEIREAAKKGSSLNGRPLRPNPPTSSLMAV